MSHAALTALMNYHSFECIVDELVRGIVTFVNGFAEFIIYFVNILYIELTKKYIETFGDKHYLALSSFLIIVYTGISLVEHYNYLDRMKDYEDQIQYIKKKNRILEGNLEFLLDNNANNELKIAKLTKQMKKVQKEVNEYA